MVKPQVVNTGCSPLRFAPFGVAFRSKYTRASSPGGGSSLTRLASRTPTGRTGPRPHREDWPVSALTRVPPQAVRAVGSRWRNPEGNHPRRVAPRGWGVGRGVPSPPETAERIAHQPVGKAPRPHPNRQIRRTGRPARAGCFRHGLLPGRRRDEHLDFLLGNGGVACFESRPHQPAKTALEGPIGKTGVLGDRELRGDLPLAPGRQ